ncbi:unnamed protein product, partial [Iphiclides podalirius]
MNHTTGLSQSRRETNVKRSRLRKVCKQTRRRARKRPDEAIARLPVPRRDKIIGRHRDVTRAHVNTPAITLCLQWTFKGVNGWEGDTFQRQQRGGLSSVTFDAIWDGYIFWWFDNSPSEFCTKPMLARHPLRNRP